MADDATRPSGIAAEEHDSYSILPGRSDRGLIILCDHAGNDLPEGYGTLGLPPEQLQRHIAYDIGAAPIARALSAALGAPAVMTRYSRLLIDPNRGPDDPTLIMRISDGAVIPGNRRLDAAERDEPHAAVLRALPSRHRGGHRPMPRATARRRPCSRSTPSPRAGRR